MRFAFVLSLALVTAMVLSGCGGKDTPPPASTTPTTTTPTNTTTPTVPPPTPPPDPEEVYNATLKFNPPPTGNDPAAEFTVKTGGTALDLTIRQKTRAANTPTSLQGEPGAPGENTDANITFTDPNGTAVVQLLVEVTAGTASAGEVEDEWVLSVENPAAGTWTAEIFGVGNNVDVEVIAVESYG